MIFSTLDRSSGYWQAEIENEDPDKATSTSQYGHNLCVRMLLELQIA